MPTTLQALVLTPLGTTPSSMSVTSLTAGTVTFTGQVTRDDFSAPLTFGDTGSFIHLRRVTRVPQAGGRNVSEVFSQSEGTLASGAFTFNHISQAEDTSSVALTVPSVTGCANNGSGLIRVTCASHGFATGAKIAIYGVLGTVEANGAWTITVITANTFDLQASTFTNAYVSGGKATNRPGMYGYFATMVPHQSRGSMTGTAANADDVVGYGVYNGSPNNSTGTQGFNVNKNSSFTGDQWYAGFSVEANVNTGYAISGNVSQWGLDFVGGGTPSTYGLGAIRLANTAFVSSLNAASNANVQLFSCNNLNEFQVFAPARHSASTTFDATVAITDGVSVTIGTSTGTKFGTNSSVKMGFFNATPVLQQSGTGTATGFVAGAGTAVNDQSTFTGAVGSTAYRISDIVKALKNLGFLAQ